MFGYVRPEKGELLVREYEFYRATYCGVCRAMKRHTGRLSTLSLSYDAVFYALIRMLLTETPATVRPCRCIAHPCRGRACVGENPALRATARAFAVLAYGKAEDAYADCRGLSRIPLFFARAVMRRAARRANNPALLADMQAELSVLATLEKNACPSVDEAADCTGRMIGRFFSDGLSPAQAALAYPVGFHLGRFIAALDAYEDYEEDRRRKNYNPYLCRGDGSFPPEEREAARLALREELCRLEEAMLRLPLSRYRDAEDILKNILYLGLPAALARLDGKGTKKKGKKNARSV